MERHTPCSPVPPSRPQVVFVMGVGRSGSTILDLFLGQHPQVQSAGELCNIVKDGWLRKELCSCRLPVPQCPLWSEVIARWTTHSGVRLEDYERLRSLVEEERRTLWQMFRRASPEQIELGCKVHGNFLTYAQWTAGLYRALSEVTGKPLVLDSSKNPARALALTLIAQRLDLIDLDLIHLVRDVRGFAWSNKKSFRSGQEPGVTRDIPARPIGKSALVWIIVNTLADWVRRRHETNRRLILRYEDFVADPVNTVLQLAGFLGVSPRPWIDLLGSAQPLKPGHVVAGNRLRMQTQITLRPDIEWQTGLAASQQHILWLLAGWKARAYGYTYRPRDIGGRAIPGHRDAAGHHLPGPHFTRQSGDKTAAEVIPTEHPPS